jgi:glycosyltransferase involved in cell wall biosynthesis
MESDGNGGYNDSQPPVQRMTGSRLKVAFFGSFYPSFKNAANSSTGIVYLLANSAGIESVHLVVPLNSRLPSTIATSNVTFACKFPLDSILGLLIALRRLVQIAGGVDGFIFNIFPTAFGRRKIVNGFGLLLPAILRAATHKPVLVYLHNLVETQEVGRLGYAPSFFTLALARCIEYILLSSCIVIVPLESQRALIRVRLGRDVLAQPLPFIEQVAFAGRVKSQADRNRNRPYKVLKVLLIGNWGPQKDLSGALHLLEAIRRTGIQIRVTIVGEVNGGFPEYEREFQRITRSLDPQFYLMCGTVPEDELLALALEQDVLLLPYNASGGYSGAMHLGAAAGLWIAAYDLPQLREQDRLLDARTVFIDPGKFEETSSLLAKSFRELLSEGTADRPRRLPTIESEASLAVENIVEVLRRACRHDDALTGDSPRSRQVS